MTSFRKMQSNAGYSDREMEQKPFKNNGKSLKSHTNRGNFILIAMLVMAIGMCAAAQEKTGYIIVKTSSGEVASFYPDAVERQYIENGNWIFELKTSAKYTYPLEDIQPFTVEQRALNSGTGVQPVTVSDWRVYDDGNSLIIENPGGAVGRYAIYDLSGKLIKTGYESGSRVSVPVPAGICIVKAGMDVKKAVKK